MSAIPARCICLVTQRTALHPDARTARAAVLALEAFLADAIEAGVDIIQIRERDLDAAPLRDLTRATVARARGTSTQVLVNDRIDVALAAGAAGVHLRDDGSAVSDVRRIVGGRVIGRSIHQVMRSDDAVTADYLLYGTVFESMSKPELRGAGVAALAEAVRSTAAPIIAIGGITPARAVDCIEAGAAGVAAISLFLPKGRAPGSLGVAEATRRLRAALEAGLE